MSLPPTRITPLKRRPSRRSHTPSRRLLHRTTETAIRRSNTATNLAKVLEDINALLARIIARQFDTKQFRHGLVRGAGVWALRLVLGAEVGPEVIDCDGTAGRGRTAVLEWRGEFGEGAGLKERGERKVVVARWGEGQVALRASCDVGKDARAGGSSGERRSCLSCQYGTMPSSDARYSRLFDLFSGDPLAVRSSSGSSMKTSKRLLAAALLTLLGVSLNVGFQGVLATL